MNKIWKIIDVLEWSKDFFASKEIESPRLNIELILCDVLKIDRIKLYTNFDLPLNENELSEIRTKVKRRAKKEPLQYLIGNTSFMGLNFNLNTTVLIPRPETEELADIIISRYKNAGSLNILDIGTGSGCIAVSLAKFLPQSHVTAIDVSESAIITAKQNAEMNFVKNISFEVKDFLKNCNFSQNYDVLVSNPPYIALDEYHELCRTEIKFEPRQALTDEGDGLLFYRKFAEVFKKMLKPDGRFFLEIGFNMADDINKIFEKNYEVNFIKDFAKIDRIVEGCIKEN